VLQADRARIVSELHRAWQDKGFILAYQYVTAIIDDEPQTKKEPT
jgi:hypothetical protein